MALAKHAVVRLRLTDLVAEALDFLRDGWKDAWLPMAVIVAAHTLGFMQKHVAAADWRPGIWGTFIPLLYLAYVPLYGALYRGAIGGSLFKAIGFGGLQWKAAEWRLILVGAVVILATGLAMLPFLAASGIAALIFGLKSSMTLGPLGQWARWTPAAVVIWLIFLWAFGPRLARLALGWPYSVARGRLDMFGGWGPSFRSGWAILLAFLLVQVPSVLASAAPSLLALFEPDALAGPYWPLPEAIVVGAVQGLLYAVVQAPLSVGVLVGAYYLLEEARPAPVEGEAGHESGLSPEAAAALSAHEAHELDLPPSQVDAAAAPEAEASDSGAHTTQDASPDPLAAHEAAAAAAAGEAYAAMENHDPPPPAELHTPDPALEGVHPAEPPPQTDAAVDEIQAHAPLAAADETSAADVDTHADTHADTPAEALVETPHDAPSESGELPHPLSRWPHSVLPPWPRRVSVADPQPHPAVSAAMPLAPQAEAPHDSKVAPSAPPTATATTPWEWSAL